MDPLSAQSRAVRGNTGAGRDIPKSNDPFFAQSDHVNPPRVPRPGELSWKFCKDRHAYACDLRYHGKGRVEAQIFKDADLLIAVACPA